MTPPTLGPSGRGARPGLRPHTTAERAAEWGRKFTVYRERRFGVGPVAGLADVAAFLRFIALRWQAPEWQQEQAPDFRAASRPRWAGGCRLASRQSAVPQD